MTDEAQEFPFRTLLIEDSRDWIEDMRTAWGKGLDIASNAVEARRLLDANRYHFITVDQNLPERESGRALPDVGVDLCRYIVSSHPCSPRVLYTAFGDVQLANRIGRMDQTEYWQKSGTGGDNPQECVYSARGWARAVRDYLASRYLLFVLRQAGRFLPATLADQARNLEKSFEGRAENGRFLYFAMDLWQSTLYLAWAQAQALAHAYRSAVDMAPPTNRLEELERGVGVILPQLALTGWLGPWGAYIGKGNAKTGEGAGRRFLTESSRPLRSFRNICAHGFSREVWSEDFGALRIPLLHLLDAAILWADHPLLTSLRAVPGEAEKWKGEAIRGDYPWPEHEVSASLRFAPYPDRVYIRWLDPDERPTLVDLWPFAMLEPDPKVNRRVLWVASHRDPSGRWWRRSLLDGQVHPWPERDSKAIKALETHFRTGSRALH